MGVRDAYKGIMEKRLARAGIRRREFQAKVPIVHAELAAEEKELLKTARELLDSNYVDLHYYDELKELCKNKDFVRRLNDPGLRSFCERLKATYSVFRGNPSALRFVEFALILEDLENIYRNPRINNEASLTAIEEFGRQISLERYKAPFQLIPDIQIFLSSKFCKLLREVLEKHEVKMIGLLYDTMGRDCAQVLQKLATVADSDVSVDALDKEISSMKGDNKSLQFSRQFEKVIEKIILTTSPQNSQKMNYITEMLGEEWAKDMSAVRRLSVFPEGALAEMAEFVCQNNLSLSFWEVETLLVHRMLTGSWGEKEANAISKLKQTLNLNITNRAGVEAVSIAASDPNIEARLKLLKEHGFFYDNEKSDGKSFQEMVYGFLRFGMDDMLKLLDKTRGKTDPLEIIDYIYVSVENGVQNAGIGMEFTRLCGKPNREYVENLAIIPEAEEKLATINRTGAFGPTAFHEKDLPTLLVFLGCSRSFVEEICEACNCHSSTKKESGKDVEKKPYRSVFTYKGAAGEWNPDNFPRAESILDLSSNPECNEILILAKELKLSFRNIFIHQHQLAKALAIQDREKLKNFVRNYPDKLSEFELFSKEDIAGIFSKNDTEGVEFFFHSYAHIREAGIEPDPQVPAVESVLKAKDRVLSDLNFDVSRAVSLKSMLDLREADKRMHLFATHRTADPFLEKKKLEGLMRRTAEFTLSPFERNSGHRREAIFQSLNNETKRIDRFGNIWASTGKGDGRVLVSAHMDTTYGLDPGDYHFDFDGSNFVGTLDNSVGCAIAAMLCEHTDYPFNIDFVFTFSEETGDPKEMGAAKAVSELRRAKKKVDVCITLDVTYESEKSGEKVGYIESFSPPSLAMVLKDVFRRNNAGSKLGGRQGNTDDEGSIVYGKEFPTFFVGPVMVGLNSAANDKKTNVSLEAVEAVYIFLKKLLHDHELIKFISRK